MSDENSETLKGISKKNCFVCDIPRTNFPWQEWKSILLDKTKTSNNQICAKIGEMIGEAFKICVSMDDEICIKCEKIINDYDKLIVELKKVKTVFMGLLQKKYDLQLDDDIQAKSRGNNHSTEMYNNQFVEYDNQQTPNNHNTSTNRTNIKKANMNKTNINKTSINKTKSELTKRITTNDSQQNNGVPNKDLLRKIYKCSRCKFVTNFEQKMKSHVFNHPDTFIECIICRAKVKTKVALTDHLKKHPDVACPGCESRFTKPYKLHCHIVTNHAHFQYAGASRVAIEPLVDSNPVTTKELERGESAVKVEVNGSQSETNNDVSDIAEGEDNAQHRCRKCRKTFETQDELYMHEHEHKRNRKGPNWTCPFCSKVCTTKGGAKVHLARHTGDYKVFCDVCKKGYMSQAALVEHSGVHTKELRYTCEICGQQFCFDASLRIHRKWHEDPKPFPCGYCGKKFAHPSVRKIHIRRDHTGERPYTCKYCDKSFLKRGNYKKHVAIHTNVYNIRCKICNAGFLIQSKYGEHLAKAHGDRSMLVPRKPCEYKVKIRPNALIQAVQRIEDDHAYEDMSGEIIVKDNEQSENQDEDQGIEVEFKLEDEVLRNFVVVDSDPKIEYDNSEEFVTGT